MKKYGIAFAIGLVIGLIAFVNAPTLSAYFISAIETGVIAMIVLFILGFAFGFASLVIRVIIIAVAVAVAIWAFLFFTSSLDVLKGPCTSSVRTAVTASGNVVSEKVVTWYCERVK